MKKQLSILISISSLLSADLSPLPFYNPPQKTPQTSEEFFLIDHIEQSVLKADALDSKLESLQLEIEGMSSPKVRHLLNNLCSLPECTYLEIGPHQGSTLVAALHDNRDNFLEVTACDNWSQFGGPKEEFFKNCAPYFKSYPIAFHESDCFALDVASILNPVKIYFYDGDQSKESLEKAFTYYNNVFDNVFIAVIDDWNWDFVREGTFAAFEQLGYRIVFEKVLPARSNGDLENYWNGLYVAVISKQ